MVGYANYANSCLIAFFFVVIGAAYVYVSCDNGETWSQKQKLLAFDGSGSDFFGASLSVYNDTIVVSAPNEDNERGTDAGTSLRYSYHICLNGMCCRLGVCIPWLWRYLDRHK